MKDIILMAGLVLFVLRGVEVDGMSVSTGDEALRLEWVPEWVAIVGSGYIGVETSDVYTALGAELTYIEAANKLRPALASEIVRASHRLLINPRLSITAPLPFTWKDTPGIPGKRPMLIDVIVAKDKKLVDTVEVDAALISTGRSPNTIDLGLQTLSVVTWRGFSPVSERRRLVDRDGSALDDVYTMGDANSEMILAHVASAQGVSAVENILGTQYADDYSTGPAICFTEPRYRLPA